MMRILLPSAVVFCSTVIAAQGNMLNLDIDNFNSDIGTMGLPYQPRIGDLTSDQTRSSYISSLMVGKREAEMQIRPTDADMKQLLETAISLGNSLGLSGLFMSNTYVLTAGAFNYRGALYNWIRHMEQQNLRNYLILCFDTKIYEAVGAMHGVLIRNGMNYTVSNTTMSDDASTLTPQRMRQNRTAITLREIAKKKNAVLDGSFQEMDKKERALHNSDEWDINLLPRATREVRGVRGSIPARDAQERQAHNSAALKMQKVMERGAQPSSGPKLEAGAEFKVMMVAKYHAIHELLKLGKAVVWSDSDCIWLRQCSTSYFTDHLQQPQRAGGSRHRSFPAVDIIGQQGMHPIEMSQVYGACMCGGFFMVNPTAAANQLIASTRNLVARTVFLKKPKDCDQSLLNQVIRSMNGFETDTLVPASPIVANRLTKNETKLKVFTFGANSSRAVQYSGAIRSGSLRSMQRSVSVYSPAPGLFQAKSAEEVAAAVARADRAATQSADTSESGSAHPRTHVLSSVRTKLSSHSGESSSDSSSDRRSLETGQADQPEGLDRVKRLQRARAVRQQHSLSIALLPYHIFPRGHPIVFLTPPKPGDVVSAERIIKEDSARAAKYAAIMNKISMIAEKKKQKYRRKTARETESMLPAKSDPRAKWGQRGQGAEGRDLSAVNYSSKESRRTQRRRRRVLVEAEGEGEEAADQEQAGDAEGDEDAAGEGEADGHDGYLSTAYSGGMVGYSSGSGGRSIISDADSTNNTERSGNSNSSNNSISWISRLQNVSAAAIAAEWVRLGRNACIWHMMTDKQGRAKADAMRRDGVLTIPPEMEKERNVSVIRRFLYG